MHLDLTQIKFYIPNRKEDFEPRSMMINECRKHGLSHEFVPSVKCDDSFIGASLDRLKILRLKKLEFPFAIMSDKCTFTSQFKTKFDLPEEADALHLGISRYGIENPGKFSQGRLDHILIDQYNNEYIQLYNNLGFHCVVYIKPEYAEASERATLQALLSKSFVYPSSIELAQLQNDFIVLSPSNIMCHESQIQGGNETSTNISLLPFVSTNLFTSLEKQGRVNNFLFEENKGLKYFLFYDIFVHYNKKKVTAVAPYYGDDLDMIEEYSKIKMTVNGVEIFGTYIPCKLDSWEPTILIDFEHPELPSIISNQQYLEIEITLSDKSNTYSIQTNTPKYETSMSVIIKNENRWISYFLNYYLDIVKVDHVYVYDNNTSEKSELHQILLPFIKKTQVTLVPWNYRWRNKIDKKQIGQPPQEAHTLNKYGAGKWIGFFDVDEILRIPQLTLPQFLSQFDPEELGGLSFGLRWAFYKGPKTLEQIENPLTEFIYTAKDSLGRKRQKLMVSPRRCRYLRFHWLPEGEIEHEVDDTDIFFHHYVIRPQRFEEYKSEIGIIDRTVVNLYNDYEKMDFLTSFLDLSFENARKEKSKLTEKVLRIEGYLGTFTKHFYNNIGALPGLNLLEVGLWRGASSCCFLENNWLKATFIDNWSEFGGPKEECIRNIRNSIGGSRVKIIENDCFSLDQSVLENYNVYSYDGPHSYDDHYRAIVNFYDVLHDIAIVIVDDWNRKHVRDATLKAIRDLKIPIFYEREIILNEEDLDDMPRHKGKDHWWDGIYVFGFNKRMLKGSNTYNKSPNQLID